MRLLICLGVLHCATSFATAKDEKPAFAPTSQYEEKKLDGWTLVIRKELMSDHADLYNRAMELLQFQLYGIERRVPESAVKKLQQVKIWVEHNDPNHPCAVYHPSAQWLKTHGMNPAKAKCVEISNAQRFLTWTVQQPFMILHELAHAYHDQFLPKGFQNPAVADAYRNAMKLKRYEKVLRINDRTVKAYATTNPQEYFAEATEAYFGTNDFYPFVKAELKKHDPEIYRVLGEVWDVTPRPKFLITPPKTGTLIPPVNGGTRKGETP